MTPIELLQRRLKLHMRLRMGHALGYRGADGNFRRFFNLERGARADHHLYVVLRNGKVACTPHPRRPTRRQLLPFPFCRLLVSTGSEYSGALLVTVMDHSCTV
jgi:hypothetical protein